MSKNKKITEQNEQKVMTKYDLKMQKRKEQKEKAKKEQRISTIIGIVVAVALVCLFAYFPIHNYMVTHETYITVGDEEISKIEYDYRYNVALNNYVGQYGDYMSYFGLDLTQDFSAQMYSDTLTWKDFFDRLAVDSIIQNRAVRAQIEAAGFTYDTAEEYKAFQESIKEAATTAGVSLSAYVKQAYGSYATMGRIEEFIKSDIVVSEYYNKMLEEQAPTEEEIKAYYESYPDYYDSVDYRVKTVKAELPTAPTELADPVEETAKTDTTAEGTTETTETEYQPSEAEIEKAMADAKVLADAAEATIKTDGELIENVTSSYMSTTIGTWLFDSARKPGDTTVIRDDINNQYYILAFEKRYLDESPSTDVRVIMTQDKTGEEILNEWKSGEATEESFAEICMQYSIDSYAATGGLYEGVTESGMPEELGSWVFDASRVAGDTTAVDVTAEDGTTTYHYVMYYVGQNDPIWKLSINNTLTQENMYNYLEEISADFEVQDPKGNLNYLKVQESEEANAESEAGTEAVDSETGSKAASGTEASAAQ